MSEWDAFPAVNQSAPRAQPAPQPAPQPQAQYSGRMPSSPDEVFGSLIAQESRGRAGAVGPNTQWGNALGRTQMLPSTARGVARNIGAEFREDLLRGDSPEAAAYQDRLGRAYLQEAWDNTSNPREALMYYHGGPDRKLWGPKTRAYADEVLAKWEAGDSIDPLDVAAMDSVDGGEWDAFPVADSGGVAMDGASLGGSVDENGFLVDDSAPRFGTRENPWELSALAEEVNRRGDDQSRQALAGNWIRTPDGVTQLRSVEVGKRNGEQIDGTNVYLNETGAAQDVGAAVMAANEQIPFSNDILAATRAATTGQSWGDARQEISDLKNVDRATDQGARNIGGVAGFGLGLLAPMAGARWAGQGGLAARSLKNLAIGGGYGALYGAGTSDADTALGRLRSGGTGAVLGGVTGAATPVVGGVASKAAEPVTNWVGRNINRLSGGRLAHQYAPSSRAARELSNSLQDDNITEEAFEGAMSRLESLGVQPTFLDVVQSIRPNGKTARIMRGSAMHDDASSIATEYAQNVQEAVPAIGQNITRNLAPHAPGNAANLSRADEMIARAIPPQSAAPGSGGEVMSRALNESRDAAKREVDAAYNAAREMEPERALVPSDVAKGISDNIRNALSDFDLRDVPSVDRALEGLLSPNLQGQRSFADLPSVRSLFEVRSRLSNVRANGDQMSQAAAGRAIRGLDSEIARITDEGLIQGDDAAVRAWQDANRLRADFGRRFEGGDLIDRITAREYRGGSMTNSLAPEDVSNAIMGTGTGIAPRPNSARDLHRIRSVSPESISALQDEAGARLLRMRGNEIAPDYETLMRQSPDLASVLVSPSTRRAIERARERVEEANALRSAVETGKQTLWEVPDTYRQTASNQDLRNSAVSTLIDQIGRNPSVIRRIGRNPNVSENLSHALGDDAARYQESMRELNNRSNNAQWINPAAGSKTAQAGMDTQKAAGVVGGLISGGKTAVLGALAKLSAGVRLSPQERRAIVEIGLSEAEALRVAADPRVSQYLVAPASLSVIEMVNQ